MRRSAPLVILAALTIVSKIPTLGAPAYWDEMGWLQQAAWLSNENLIRAIPGFREPWMFWGHPTGLHFILGAVAKVFGGVSLTLAHLLIAVFSAIGVCATYLLARRSFEPEVAWTAALLLLLSPVYFAQSGMFLADIPVTALGALSTFLAMSRRYRAYVACASCMVLLKETAAAIVLAIAVYKFLEARHTGGKSVRELLRHGAPLAVIGSFIFIQRLATGQYLWIYNFPVEFVRVTPDSVRHAFGLVNAWIFIHQGRVVFTALIVLGLIVSRAARRRSELVLFLLLLVFSGWPFAFIYYLPRYVTPILPLFFILAAAAVFDLVQRRSLRRAGFGVLVAFAAVTLATQRMRGNGETSLRYLDVAAMNKAAATIISERYPQATVAAVFPNSAALRNPLSGYVDRAMVVNTFRDSSALVGATVILVSSPSADGDAVLRDLALRDSWPMIARFEASGAWAEIYAKDSASIRSVR